MNEYVQLILKIAQIKLPGVARAFFVLEPIVHAQKLFTVLITAPRNLLVVNCRFAQQTEKYLIGSIHSAHSFDTHGTEFFYYRMVSKTIYFT